MSALSPTLPLQSTALALHNTLLIARHTAHMPPLAAAPATGHAPRVSACGGDGCSCCSSSCCRCCSAAAALAAAAAVAAAAALLLLLRRGVFMAANTAIATGSTRTGGDGCCGWDEPPMEAPLTLLPASLPSPAAACDR
jgi:hypothetical protein